MPEGERILIILWHFFFDNIMALILDFLITPTYSTKTIGITDVSTYENDPPTVTTPTLEVSIPGFDTITVPFVPESLNVLNSTVLELTEVGEEEQPLPDGVYVFRYSVDPSDSVFVEKTIMRVEQLQEKFDAAFMKLDLANCSDKITKQQKVSLDTIYYFIQGAIAAANNCATTEAVELYQKADKLLYNLTERGECCGITFPNNFY
jgi:hypothetical protein